MSLLNHQLELLAPARDADIGIAAIDHGADAVYIGGPAFGARASAGNDVREIERLVRHAHRFGARIFVTHNTILRDDELEAARRMAWDVYHAGADVLIIQDMGLLELELPPIQLHASTQTDIRTPEKARFLQDVGFSRVVIEGRYKDVGYVKNITAHYRKLLDELIESREGSDFPLVRASSGRTTFSFTPDPNQNFNREFTDYFVNGRQDDIGAFDSPKNPGQAIGWVTKVGLDWIELELDDPQSMLHNGDGLCYFDLQKELVGVAINRAERLSPPPPGEGQAGGTRWRIFPKDPIAGMRDLRKGARINRNRDMDWVRTLEKKSSERRIGVWASFADTPEGVRLRLTDEDGFTGAAAAACEKQPAHDPIRGKAALRDHLVRFGATIFEPLEIAIDLAQPWFIPASLINQLRRSAVEALEAARAGGYRRPERAEPVVPPVPYPEDSLTYLANVFNQKARDFYARHGVKVIDAAYESHEEEGEVSLMITKHCVRWSMSLCPKQAKGVVGVKGTIKAEPLQLINGSEKLTLRFDCKPCEMHVVGKMKKSVTQQRAHEMAEVPMQFYRTRPVRVTS